MVPTTARNSAIHWFCMDDSGIVGIYRELIVSSHGDVG
jgi:hypothetical protein